MKCLAALCFVLFLALSPIAADTIIRPSETFHYPSGYTRNPFIYLYGNVTDAIQQKAGDTIVTELDVKPVGTYLTFPGNRISFCGDVSNSLDFGKDSVVVIIYRRQEGHLGCHDLLRIDVIEKARIAGGK